MKKRVLSVLLVIALLVAVGIVAAQANETDPTPAEIKAAGEQIVTTANAMTFEAGNIPTTCPKCGENITWQELNQDNFTEGARTGHWYLSSNITVEDTTRNPALISASGTLCLHLNGHSISVTSAGFDGRCLYASTGNTLNLYGTGSINGQGPATAMWVWGGTANIYGGDFNAANSTACIEMRANGTLNFFGGSQSTGKIRHAAANTVLNVYGGSISNFSASGTDNIATAKTNIYGGTVTTAAAYGSALTVTGGNITTLDSCAPTSTGGIFVSGNPQIANVGNPTLCKFTYGELTEGASINYGTYTGVISTAYETKPEAEEIAATFPEMQGLSVTVNDAKELVLGARTYTPEEIITESAKQTFGTTEKEDFCYACGKMVTWKPYTKAMASITSGQTILNKADEHYFLAFEEDSIETTSSTTSTIPLDIRANTCLHLNGKSWTATSSSGNGYALLRLSSGNANIMGNGTLHTSNQRVLSTTGTGNLNVYGGTYTTTEVTGDAWGMLFDAGTANFYGGTVTAGAIGVRSSGNLVIENGTFNTSRIDVYNTATINGGTFGCYITTRTTGQLTVNNGTFNSYLANYGGTMDLYDGDFKLWIAANKGTNAEAKIRFYGGQYSGSNLHFRGDGGTIEIDGANITIPISTEGLSIKAAAVCDINVKNGSVKNVEMTANTDATLTVTGGNVTGTVTATYGDVNISGGAVNAVNAAATAGTVAVSNGTVTNLTTAVGANISGGTVNTLTATAGNVVLSGAPTVGLDTALDVDATGLTGGQISGMKEGVFTTAFPTKAAAEAVIPYFVAVDPNEVTATDDFKLTYGARSYTIEQKVTLSQAQDFGNQAVPVEKYCYACGSMETWQPLTDIANPGAGHFFLADDLEVERTTGENYGLYFNGLKICLHLNGNTIRHKGSTAYSVARVRGSGTGVLNIMGNGEVYSAAQNHPTIYAESGEVNVYGGEYFNEYSAWSQRNAFTVGSTGVLNIYDATVDHVIYNDAVTYLKINATGGTTNIFGGNIYRVTQTGGEVNINAGTVTEFNAAASANVTGGNITTLNATAGTTGVSGGNITTLNASGATVTANATIGTLNATAGTVTLSGAPTISALNATVAVDAKGLTGGQIGLGSTTGVFTTAFANKSAAEAVIPYFVVVEGTAVTAVEQGEDYVLSYGTLTIEGAENIVAYANNMSFTGADNQSKFCPHCNKIVTWKAFNDDFDSGYATFPKLLLKYNNIDHFYVSGTVTTQAAAVLNNHHVVLHLNNQTVNYTAANFVNPYGGASITILGQGTVTTAASPAIGGGGTTNIYGGTYSTTATGNTASAVAGTTVNLYAGTTNAAPSGYGVFLSPGKTFNVYGGTVNGRIYHDGVATTNISGGTINSESIGFSGGTVTISGGTFTGTEIGIGGSENQIPALNLNGGTFTNDVNLNNHGGVGVVTFGANFDQTITVTIEKLTEEAGYGRTEALYKATTAGLNGAVYGKDVDGNVYGLVYDSVANNGNLVVAKTSIVNGENVSWYENNAAAVTAFNGTGYIKLYTEDAIALNKNVTVDFNGKTVDVTGSGTLTGLDSYTEGGFARRPGVAVIPEGQSITVAAPAATTAADGTVSGYLPITTEVAGETEATFTYYTMKLSGVALKANPQTVGIYYKGTWNFNDYLPEGKVEAGVVVNVQDQNDTPFANGFRSNNANGYYSAPAENIANGEPVTSVLVNDIMKADRNDAALNSQYGQMKIKAAAFVTVNGQDILTDIKNLSVKDILDMFELDENVEKYNAMETKLGKFYQTWVNLADLSSWNLKKIPNIEIAA